MQKKSSQSAGALVVQQPPPAQQHLHNQVLHRWPAGGAVSDPLELQLPNLSRFPEPPLLQPGL
jgi:hypothetical protein